MLRLEKGNLPLEKGNLLPEKGDYMSGKEGMIYAALALPFCRGDFCFSGRKSIFSENSSTVGGRVLEID